MVAYNDNNNSSHTTININTSLSSSPSSIIMSSVHPKQSRSTPSSINNNPNNSNNNSNNNDNIQRTTTLSSGSLGGNSRGSRDKDIIISRPSSSPEGRTVGSKDYSIGGDNTSIGGGGGGSKSSREQPSLGSIQNITPAGSINKAVAIIPKNPKDTAAYPPSIGGNSIRSSNSGTGGGGGGVVISPKRRVKSVGHGNSLDFGPTFGSAVNNINNIEGTNSGNLAAFAGSGGGSLAMPPTTSTTCGGNSYHGGKSVNSVPTDSTYSNNYAAAGGGAMGGGGGGAITMGGSVRSSTPPLVPQSTTTPGSVASLHSMKDIVVNNSGATDRGLNASMPNVNTSSNAVSNHNIQQQHLDDEEQYMFEQRLTQDDLGVAIRKISHSGKAQLRYVKCIPLRPPSSSDFDDGKVGPPLTLSGSNVSSGPTATVNRSNSLKVPPSDSVSVSSKSSTGSRFLERMRSSASGRLLKGLPPHTSSNTSSANIQGATSTSLLNHDDSIDKQSLRALSWGKKNAVTISLDQFTCVTKGKCTERTIRNSSPSSRLLSIMSNDVAAAAGKIDAGTGENRSCLDIEAPTKLDRDKFASAFAKFLGVPLIEEKAIVSNQGGAVDESGGRVGRTSVASAAKKKIRTPSLTRSRKKNSTPNVSAAHSEPGITNLPSPSPIKTQRERSATEHSGGMLRQQSNVDANNGGDLAFEHDFGKETIGGSVGMAPSERKVSDEIDFGTGTPPIGSTLSAPGSRSSSRARAGSNAGGDDNASKQTRDTMSESARKRISTDSCGPGESMLEPPTSTPVPLDTSGEGANGTVDNTDNHSHVSSLTGGVDQEIVEELHQAIIELRSELDASRAEAGRAVKVAEQAIQSAENCTSSDWNSTVTHKAAEAAAQAQKKSAEAIARARIAEERLTAERKSTSFWRRQAQCAEEEAGSLKTRSAAAEVKKAVMMEELASERRKAARMFASLKKEYQQAEQKQEGEMVEIQARKRILEVELDETKRDLVKKADEANRQAERLSSNKEKEKSKGPNRMRSHFRRQSPAPKAHRGGTSSNKRSESPAPGSTIPDNVTEQITSLQSDTTDLRKQFELVKHTTKDELVSLHRQSQEWSSQASRAIAASTAEADLLREKLAAESAMRLKLLTELQDIRGTVRVYCRPKPAKNIKAKNVMKIPTHDILVLNEDTAPMSFKYDRVFSPNASQYEVFSELEEPLISSLDGFNVTLLAFGQGGSGKTYTLMGDISLDDEKENDLPSLESHGVQLQAIQQLFTIAGHRTDRYKDEFSMTMVEVHNEKLFDLVAGTPSGEQDGEVIICETRDSRRDKRRESGAAGWPKGKLEIRTNTDGNTVVQGVVSIPIESFEDAITIHREAIANRLIRQGSNWKKYGRRANVITTIHITSVNIATGVGTEGKLQFVDMASSDITPTTSKEVKDDSSASKSNTEEDDTKFANKSIDAFNDVITARCQFDRSVPYRNSTLTHLLRDSLEADTKVLLMCFVSSEEAHLADTVGTLRFAAKMQKVSIGKATKHIVGSKEV